MKRSSCLFVSLAEFWNAETEASHKLIETQIVIGEKKPITSKRVRRRNKPASL